MRGGKITATEQELSKIGTRRDTDTKPLQTREARDLRVLARSGLVNADAQALTDAGMAVVGAETRSRTRGRPWERIADPRADARVPD